ncbi:MAG: hypothetical protein ABW252_21310 [Polyangiales bacterium]
MFAAVACTLFVAAEPATRAAERPSDPEEVVAHVPARESPTQRRIAQLAEAAANAPNDASRAVALARAHVEASRADGDPRHLGEAEAVLARFVRSDAAPEVRILHATLLQARHAFPEALRELDRALAARPGDPQALLTRATVLTVRGAYREARASCEALRGRVTEAIGVGCHAPIDALQGRYAEARAALDRALAFTRTQGEQALLLSLRGEQAYWHGDLTDAEASLKDALALDPSDRYTRALYADLLLDAARPDEVAPLVRAHLADDALALRDALAAVALGADDAPAKVARLASGFAESRLRGDAVHQREEARLWLAQPGAEAAQHALTRARESWGVQHEPWDARVVLEAALRADRPEAAREVRAWLAETGFEAERLQTFRARLQMREAENKP